MREISKDQQADVKAECQENQLLLHLKDIEKSLPTIVAGEVVGSGAYSKVLVSRRFNTEVAVKRITVSDLLVDRDETALINLHHPNIIKFFGVRQHQRFKYVFLEYFRFSLEDYCLRKYWGPVPERLPGLFQLSDGLDYIHSRNLVHRSINTKNIFIHPSPSGERAVFKLSDFGIGIPSWEDYEHLITTEYFNWLNWYHSPELIRRHQNIDDMFDPRTHPFGNPSADIFALGCVFFAFLTRGKHPFNPKESITSQFIADCILSSRIFFHHLGDANQDVKPIIARMIRDNPDKRPSTHEVNRWLRVLNNGGLFRHVLKFPYTTR